jgi:pimeloyl-ACP methyl ester carboxylesterase
MKAPKSRTPSEADRILAVVSAARDVPGGVRYDLEIVDRSERIPGILMMPNGQAQIPAALLLHGFGSRKELMADVIGGAFIGRGVAALAIDLPLHGGRTTESPADLVSANPMRLLSAWRTAVREVRLALDYLAQHDRVDAQRLGLVGYSLGSFLANIVAADTSSVRAVVLASSGDLPEGLPFESLVRAMVDPLRAVRRVAGRPVLMVNGRFDRIVKPSQAERLFAQAHEPKMMRWYGGGHWPPAREIEHAAEWMAAQLGTEERSRRKA